MSILTLLYLSLMPEEGQAPFSLSLNRETNETGDLTYLLELEPGKVHRVSGQDFPALLRDIAAYEPNRWREEANLQRLNPPLSDLLTVDQDLLLRAMALVMGASRKEHPEDPQKADVWLMEGLQDGVTISGPARQFRTIHLIDPEKIPEADLDILDTLWAEGFLMELVVNPRQDLGPGVIALYATPAWNKALIPKVINLGSKENEFWKNRVELIKNSPVNLLA